jgi:hypothetical protein
MNGILKLVLLVLFIASIIWLVAYIGGYNRTYLQLETEFVSCVQSSFLEKSINMKDKADPKIFESIVNTCKEEVL